MNDLVNRVRVSGSAIYGGKSSKTKGNFGSRFRNEPLQAQYKVLLSTRTNKTVIKMCGNNRAECISHYPYAFCGY